MPEFKQPEVSDMLAVWKHGLSAIRRFKPSIPHETEWNFGACSPPSYVAFGRMRALLSQMQTSQLPGQRVLEVAAGDGALAAALAEQGREVYANDLRAEQLRASLAHLQFGERVAVIEGNIFDLDAGPAGGFDLIIACEVIEHVAHPDQFLARLRSLLNTGGMLYLTTPNGRYFRNRLPNFSQISDPRQLEARQFQPDADGHLFLLTPAELTHIAKQAEFGSVQISFSGSPFISGHAGFRALRRLRLRRACWLAERACMRLPRASRDRLFFNITAILSQS